MRLEGRKALVTGGASGIGAAIARRLAAEGAEVVDRRPQRRGRDEVAGEICGRGDRARRHRPRLGARPRGRAVGTLDILVNNAGTDEFGFFADIDARALGERDRGQPDGVFNCTHAALPGMQEAGYGRIVNIASEAGRVGSKGSAVYSAAKGGVIAFTKVIAREGARFGINANGDRPGPDRDAAADAGARVRRDRARRSSRT